MADDTIAKSDDLGDEAPEAAELAEPSTQKDPGEQPKAPDEHDPEPDHEAIGIGVTDPPAPNAG